MTGNYRRRGPPPESSPGPDDESGAPVGGNCDGSIREQDRFLPIANVGRIMKRSLPVNAKISKDAKETVQECVSEFISFITGEASEKCHREKRKTVNGDDLLWSMTTLGFVNYVQPLKIYLHRYRELEGEKTTMAKHGDQSPSEDGTLTGAIRTVMDDSNGNRSTISSKCSGSLYSGIPRVCGYDDGTGLWRR